MKKYLIKSKKLVKILEDRGEVLKEAKKVTKEVEKLQKEQQKLGYKMNRLKDKTEPIMEKEKESMDNMAEFDYVARIFIEDGKAYAEVKNQLEDYKEMLREKNDKCDNSKQEGAEDKDKS